MAKRNLVATLVAIVWAGSIGMPNAAMAKDECHEMARKTFVSNLPKAVDFFVKSDRFPVERVTISAGETCGNDNYFVFEAKPEFNNPGYHWLVVVDGLTGKMTILDGI
ncbi:hypothetical protein [Dyella sp. ASV21]|uniref:hypothetical protein n=1 Tax=Dyella sp. ASV21 TaxID=2795114 RepID=UPI0018ED301D|nr:hypothetical protein [Dyella sp. ASV21]